MPANPQQDAQQAEAAGTGLSVLWQGIDWTFPDPKQWPKRVLHYVDRDKNTLALEEILGPKQYEKWLDLPLSIEEASGLFDEIAKAAGLDSEGE